MKKDVLFTVPSYFRDDMDILGYRFGKGEKSCVVLGALRGHQLTWELSCFAEAVACALPEHRADIQSDAARNARRRAELAGALKEMGIYVYPSQSACLLADFGRPVAPIEEKLREQRILVRSCMSFDDINDGCHLRLAVKDEASNRRLIQAIKEAIQCAENH